MYITTSLIRTCSPYFLIFALFMLGTAQLHLLGALCIHIFCLMPAALLLTRNAPISLKIFVISSMLVSTISLINFFIAPDAYFFNDHRPFGFTYNSASRVSILLGFFLFLVAFFSQSLKKFQPNINVASLNGPHTTLVAKPLKRTGVMYFNMAVYVVVIVSLPIKNWMFDSQIGLVGIEPPRLPFRLSGILYYLFNLITPLLLAYLYTRSRRNFSLSLVVLFYGAIIGVLSTSKAVFLYVAAPVAILSFVDRRWFLFIVSLLAVAIGTTVILLARSFVHRVSEGASIAAFDGGGLSLLWQVASNLEFEPELLLVFSALVNRIDGFQGLYLSAFFDPSVVGGPWQLLKAAVYSKLASLDTDKMHMEFLGYTLPDGFIGVSGSINNWVLMAANRSYYMVPLFAAYTAAMLNSISYFGVRISYKYNLSITLSYGIVGMLTLYFYLAPGAQSFVVSMLVALGVAFSPRIVFRNNQAFQKLES